MEIIKQNRISLFISSLFFTLKLLLGIRATMADATKQDLSADPITLTPSSSIRNNPDPKTSPEIQLDPNRYQA